MSHGLLVIRQDFIWVYGARFVTYDKQLMLDEQDGDVPDAADLKVAIDAFHNQFF